MDLPSQDAWTRAKARYVEDLTKEEKRLYCQATPETLFYGASAAQKKYTLGSSTYGVVEKLQPLRHAIEQYAQALDLAGEFGKYFKKLIEMFERIGDVLPQFRVYERLFSNHERLVQALSLAYVDIIKFCSKCKAVFRHGQRSSKTSLKLGFKLIWKPFERQFGQQIEEFRQHRKNIEMEAGLAHMIESAESRALVLANQMQLDQEKKEAAHRRIIEMIPCVDTESKHRKLRELRYPDTGQWLLHNNRYMAWVASDASPYLCCHGILGRGKTVLASLIIDDLLDRRTLQIDRILGTILKQFIHADSLPEGIRSQMEEAFGQSSVLPSTGIMIDLVCLALSLGAAVLVLDGLDECEKDVKNSVMVFLKRLISDGISTVKIFLFCRDEDEILRSFDNFTCIQATPLALEGDIRSFVTGTVDSVIASGKLKIRNPALKEEVIAELSSKACGMFLWVFFQLDDICGAISDGQIREILQNLPIGLVETYQRILAKTRASPARAAVALKSFQWIACCQRPLHVDELAEAVAFDTSDKCWNIDKIPDKDLMLESCKGLAVRDHIENTVRFAHHTVKQFILSIPIVVEEIPLSFRLSQAEIFVGQFCVTYLLFTDFETQVTHWRPNKHIEPVGLLQSGGSAYIPNVPGMGKSVFNIAYRVLGGDPQLSTPRIDYRTHLQAQKEKSSMSEFTNKYRLLQYVIDFWAVHTRKFGSNGSKSPDLHHKFHDLARYKTLPFEFRPWGANQHFGPYGCVSCAGTQSTLSQMSLFHYAAEIGHWTFMESLAEEYCAHERYTGENFMIACRNGQQTIVQELRKDSRFSHRFDQEALNVSAASGQKMIVDILLAGSVSVGNYTHWLDKPLLLAATNGYSDIVAELCSHGASVSYKNELTGRTAFDLAAIKGHTKVVRAFLPCVRMSQLHFALYCGAELGHEEVVRVLLEWSSFYSLNDNGNSAIGYLLSRTHGKNGLTALHIAVINGHAPVVGILIEHATKYGISWGQVTKGVLPGKDKEDQLNVFHLAAMYSHVNILEILLEREFPVESKSGSGSTALHLAAGAGHETAVRWLIAHDACINAGCNLDSSGLRTFSQYTPLDCAARAGHEGVIHILLDHGVVVSGSLITAAWYKQSGSLRVLLENSTNRFDRQEISQALLIAKTNEGQGRHKLVEQLRSASDKFDARGGTIGSEAAENSDSPSTKC